MKTITTLFKEMLTYPGWAMFVNIARVHLD